MRPALLLLPFLSISALGVEPGQLYQYEGVNQKGQPCAISFRIAPPSAYSGANEEELTDIKVYTTLEADVSAAYEHDMVPSATVSLKKHLGGLASNTFDSFRYHHEPFESEERDLQLKGDSLDKLTDAKAVHKFGGDFLWTHKAFFECHKMHPAKDIDALAKRIADLSDQQIRDAQARRDAERQREQDAAAAKQKKQQEEAVAKAEAARKKAIADEPARRARIDEQRRRDGLTEITWPPLPEDTAPESGNAQ